MADQLNLYNEALTDHLGERRLATLEENRGPRRQLDGVWDREFIAGLLQEGQWNFATRTMKLEASESIEPAFGRQFAFEKPIDLARITYICEDELFLEPLLEYEDEGDLWIADYDVIYIRYVSTDSEAGNDIGNWPPNFTRWAAGVLALRSTKLITQNKIDKEKLEKTVDKLLLKAKNTDAMKDPTRFTPPGRWTQSRSWGTRAQDRRHAQRGPA